MKRIIFGVSFFILILALLGISTNNVLKNEAKKLKPVEIKEYQGKKLSSTEDFRENSIKGPQHIDKKNYRLVIAGLVNNPREYIYDEIIKRQNYKKVVTLHCVEGWSVNILWEGILVRDLIKEAGADPKAKIIIFHAYDGYSTSFPLNYIMNNDIIMAHKMNGLPLPPERGFPFQLVAESKWGYKWIKWITKIELSDNEEYRGYWERRGYSNDGSLNRYFFEK
ncbi:MAG: molybdopterin-dependent oxidoreductase [Nitrospirae bacterium]|nr:molybdopterin-dependent oxidoreductase [Nitrospirota bacterium]